MMIKNCFYVTMNTIEKKAVYTIYYIGNKKENVVLLCFCFNSMNKN